MTLPSLFLSHGSPAILVENSQARDFLKSYAGTLARPDAVLLISAHYETASPQLTSGKTPETIYDFRNMPDELFKATYPAPGKPELAREVAQHLKKAGFPAALDRYRGFDHGCWVPMKLMYPDADIPVVQLSIQTAKGAAHHLALGAALRPLRARGVLVIGSGSATHNLSELRRHGYAAEAEAPQWVIAFSEWVHQHVEAGDTAALMAYRERAPHAVRNHPSEEHFLPLLVAMGAGGVTADEPSATPGRLIHSSHTYGVLAMDAYAFE